MQCSGGMGRIEDFPTNKETIVHYSIFEIRFCECDVFFDTNNNHRRTIYTTFYARSIVR